MKQTKFFKLTRIITIAVIIIFLMTACNNDENESEMNGGGTFLITDIPEEYNGKYIMLYAYKGSGPSSINLWGVKKFFKVEAPWGYSWAYTLVKISNGQAVLPTFVKIGYSEDPSPYFGNDSFYVRNGNGMSIDISIYDNENDHFANGNGASFKFYFDFWFSDDSLNYIVFNNGSAEKSATGGTWINQ